MVKPWLKIWTCLPLLLLASCVYGGGKPRLDDTDRAVPNRRQCVLCRQSGLASYLIVTPQGDILINSSLESSVPLIRTSVEQLGFHFQDIKILLISHAHSDHDAGSAEVKRETGAKYMVMDGDVSVVESGGADFAYPQSLPRCQGRSGAARRRSSAARGTVLVAHKTPGHTRGCTTWTLRGGRAAAQCCHRRQLECQRRLSAGGPPGPSRLLSRDCR